VSVSSRFSTSGLRNRPSYASRHAPSVCTMCASPDKSRIYLKQGGQLESIRRRTQRPRARKPTANGTQRRHGKQIFQKRNRPVKGGVRGIVEWRDVAKRIQKPGTEDERSVRKLSVVCFQRRSACQTGVVLPLSCSNTTNSVRGLVRVDQE
jgi:hypothetical protein